MKRWLKKTLIGTMAACSIYTCGYVVPGNLYDLAADVNYEHSDGKGHFNRKKDQSFRDEMLGEAKDLKKRINEAYATKAKRQFTLDIVVSENVKSYFDDKNDSDDNDVWEKYVKNAVVSLKAYGEVGIGFKVRNVFCISGENLDDERMYNMALTLPVEKWADISLVLVPIEDMGKKGTRGYVYEGLDVALIGITHNQHLNKTTTLHEVGHVLGLEHKYEDEKKRMLLDPFCIFYKESFMVTPANRCSEHRLKDDEARFLRKKFGR